jgi:serine/threonine-protein kinase
MRRREFVSTACVAAVTGVTGCTGGGNGDGEVNGDDGTGGAENGEGEDPTQEDVDTTEGQDGNATDMTGQNEVEVEVGAGETGFRFDPADIVVDAGTTVVWTWVGGGGSHDVTHADGDEPYEVGDEEAPIQREAGGETPLFKSELVNGEGHEFTYTFEESGTYEYVCTVHVTQGMVGSVEVE